MKIKNGDLNNDVIASINTFVELDINPVAAFKFACALKEITEIVKIKTETEKKIFDKYAMKDEEGKLVMATDDQGNEMPNHVKIDDVASFNKEMQELAECEVDLNITPLKIDSLGLDKVKTSDIMKLQFIFEL